MATTCSPLMNGTVREMNMSAITNTTVLTHQYDARGAMLFTIATVLLYGMSIVAFIAGHLGRRQHSKEEENQISKYLKRADDIRRQGVKDDVLRLRSQLLAGSLIETNKSSERRKSRVERAKRYILNDIKCVTPIGENSASMESLILPACTIPAPCPRTPSPTPSDDAPEIPAPSPVQETIFFLSETKSDVTPEGDSEDNNVPESRHFIQTHGGGMPRKSLHASLDQSVISDHHPQSPENERISPDGSPDFNKARKYRSKRRGCVLPAYQPPSASPEG